MKSKQSEMQIQYDALLEMFGQKVSLRLFRQNQFSHFKYLQAEEYEELKLDLVDLKSISQIQKTQINDLTQKLNDFKPTWERCNGILMNNPTTLFATNSCDAFWSWDILDARFWYIISLLRKSIKVLSLF